MRNIRSNRIRGIGVKMKIARSYALKKFKKEIGQANHFLITILVGLDGVKSGNIEKNIEFDAAWNPKSVIASAERSRLYAIKSSLAWVVDCFDMYLRLCNRKPRLLSEELSNKFDGIGHSIYGKYRLVSDAYALSESDKAVVDLLICWRNRMVHFDADNDISKESRNVIESSLYEDELVIKTHLDIGQMLYSFDKKESPKFKEITFMVRKTISFIECLDRLLLDKKDTLSILDDRLCDELKNNNQIFNGIFLTEGDKRKQKLIQFIKNCGFIDLDNNNEDEKLFIENISAMSYREAKNKLLSGTFKK